MGGLRGRSERSESRSLRRVWPIVVVVIAVVGLAVAWRARSPQQEVVMSRSALPQGTVVTALARRETRPTLDPQLFVGKARLAHEVAREIPGVLDQLYCYCECDKHMGHKSLLSCYTDGHAAT